jgi:hypothetical protein
MSLEVEDVRGAGAVVAGRTVINFVSTNYLGIDYRGWLEAGAGCRGVQGLSLSLP